MNDYQKYLKYKSKYLQLKTNMDNMNRDETRAKIIDEIHFWGHQLMEHALFLHLGLESPTLQAEFESIANICHSTPVHENSQLLVSADDLKNQAYNLYIAWKVFMNKYFQKIDVDKIVLNNNDISHVNLIDMHEVFELIKKSENLNNRILSQLAKKKWIGWIFASLVQHMQQETVYFSKKITNQKISIMDEIKYINSHNMGEIRVTRQWIDPAPENAQILAMIDDLIDGKLAGINKSDANILKGLESGELQAMLYLSLKYTDKLIEFGDKTNDKISHGDLKSVINPIILNHCGREFKRFKHTLQLLQN